MNLTDLTIKQAIDMMGRGEFTPSELLEAHLLNIGDDKYNAFTIVTVEAARAAAKASDQKFKDKEQSIIEGIPIGVKDLFCTKGIKTTAGSKMLENFIPQYESKVTSLLQSAGGVMIGKTGMDEFAMGSSNLTSLHGSVINPWSKEKKLVPGGSSGGSAAATAAKFCMGALGSDTGGSIRQPASFCGVVGVKPSYGRCSRWGMIAFASSLDQAGVFARTVEDSAILLQSICGYDANDSTASDMEIPDFTASIKKGVKGLRIGVPDDYLIEGTNQDIINMWEEGKAWLKSAGAQIVNISLPHTKYALPTYYIVASSEASSNLARYDGVRYGLRVEGQDLNDMYEKTRAAGFGAEVKRRILMGTYILSAGYYEAYYLKGQKVRRKIWEDFITAWSSVDAILTPTTPSPAFGINDKITDPVNMYLNDVFTVPASLAGLPCMSVPARLSSVEKLPLGLQVITKLYDEVTMFQVAKILEESANFRYL